MNQPARKPGRKQAATASGSAIDGAGGSGVATGILSGAQPGSKTAIPISQAAISPPGMPGHFEPVMAHNTCYYWPISHGSP